MSPFYFNFLLAIMKEPLRLAHQVSSRSEISINFPWQPFWFHSWTRNSLTKAVSFRNIHHRL